MASEIKIESPEELKLKESLKDRDDAEAKRMLRFLNMPDLSRAPESPIHELMERIANLPDFKNFDIIQVPEIVQADIHFDLFNFPKDHPARSRSDTYYVSPVRSRDLPERPFGRAGGSPRAASLRGKQRASTSNGMNDDYILRTHTTIMWYYWLALEAVKEK